MRRKEISMTLCRGRVVLGTSLSHTHTLSLSLTSLSIFIGLSLFGTWRSLACTRLIYNVTKRDWRRPHRNRANIVARANARAYLRKRHPHFTNVVVSRFVIRARKRFAGRPNRRPRTVPPWPSGCKPTAKLKFNRGIGTVISPRIL